MIKYLLFICLSVGFVSCKKEIPLQITTKTYDLKSDLDCTAGNCTYVHFGFQVVSGNESVSKSMNNCFVKFGQSIVALQNDKTASSYDTLALNFIHNYNEVYRTYPGRAVAWEGNFKVNHQDLSPKLYQLVW